MQGDLNEFFERNINLKGIRKAKWIYVFDVLRLFRLYTIRKPEFINFLINFIMIGSYIKTSEHSLVRNKLFSAINIVEIAVSMAVGLLMIGTLLDMYAYDKFHEKHNRIYRVLSRYGYLGSKDDQYNATTLEKRKLPLIVKGIGAVSETGKRDYNEDETVFVTFNGEIFNFQPIERELIARGHVFRTRCDTASHISARKRRTSGCRCSSNVRTVRR